MLDSDLARLYQVQTSALNQAVKRNLFRFPTDFMFQLTKAELKTLISQFVISNKRLTYEEEKEKNKKWGFLPPDTKDK